MTILFLVDAFMIAIFLIRFSHGVFRYDQKIPDWLFYISLGYLSVTIAAKL